MMVAKLGINGFGRIGRSVFRNSLRKKEIEVVAINDPFMDLKHLAYLLKYDSVHGKFPHDVKVENGELFVDNKKVHVHNEKDPAQIPWGKYNIDVVCESAGIFLTKELATAHIKGGAKRVILSALPKDDTPIYVVGINHDKYNPKELIISNASCTTNCLTPLIKVVHDNFGIVEGLSTTLLALSPTQSVVDGPSKVGGDWRAGRCASHNIVPYAQVAAKVVGKILPDLNGKLDSTAFRIPVGCVSVVDLVCRLQKPAKYEDIVNAVKKAADGPLKGILGYTEDEVVSQDFLNDDRSSIFDIKAGLELNNNFFKLIAWYDNEWGHSNRILDLAIHIAKQ